MSNGALTAKWLKQAQSAVNEDPGFRARGSMDVKLGVKVGKTCFLVTFAGFSCHAVQKLADADARDADFIVEFTPERWTRFIEDRRNGSGRSLAEIDNTDGVVKAANPRRKLDFLRYHTSLQAFFDAGAKANSVQAA